MAERARLPAPLTARRQDRSNARARFPSCGACKIPCHLSSESDALCNTAIFRVIERRVRDLETIDRGLDRGKKRGKADLANRLRMFQTKDRSVNEIIHRQAWIQFHQTTHGILNEDIVSPGKLRMMRWEVVRDVDDGGPDLAQVAEFDDSGYLDRFVFDIDPEVGADGALQLHNDTADADAVDTLVGQLPGPVYAGEQLRNEWNRNGRDNVIACPVFLRGFDAVNFVVFDLDGTRRSVQVNLAATLFDCIDH